jgi:alpha-L-fucosidase
MYINDSRHQIYEPTLESVKKHMVPQWYEDAKFGIFLHWGLFSVPAFAPIDKRDIVEIIKEDGWKEQVKNNPYAEWYLNSLRIKNSPVQKYHEEKYGRDYSYDNFAKTFNESIKSWDPDVWADTFKNVGARYVVLVTKHHDGFLLWPSNYPNPKKKNWQASRDIVGELSSSVKSMGMRIGFYYSGGFDWTFNEKAISDIASFITNGPVEQEYIDYVHNHFRELIDKYEPSVLFNDIGFPPETNLYELFAYYYNKIPDGVVNDRWMQIPKKRRWIYRLGPIRKTLERKIKKAVMKDGMKPRRPPHCDYSTPEYTTLSSISEQKWECVRGVGKSFGYNQFETTEHYLTAPELIRMLVDIVSKNGNLLLNIGPMADGTLPEIQVKRVTALGEWLKVNGDAIYDSRPWIRAEGKTDCNTDVRFTKKGDRLCVILMDTPKKRNITIKNLHILREAIIVFLGTSRVLTWQQNGEDLFISLPDKLPEQPAHVLMISQMESS